MAKLFPSIDYNGIKVKSESEIYKLLSQMDENKTKDWVIFYSYAFKKRSTGFYDSFSKSHLNNEIDFLILAPKTGIFVLEVKGGDIQVDDGIIKQFNRLTNECKVIDPYEQAKKNFYSLRDVLSIVSNKIIKLDEFNYGTLVAFPDIYSIPNVGLRSNGLDTYVGRMSIYDFIIENAIYTSEQKKTQKIPTKKDINEIEKALKGANFIYNKSTVDYIESINLSIDNLTEGQEIVFRGLLDNDRCLIKGKAGTGKTVLCQFLYKYLTMEKKQSVIYLTFNELISMSINDNFESVKGSCCVPIFQYLEEAYIKATGNPLPQFSDYKVKKDFLMEHIEDIYVNQYTNIKYDCLIIDEAQDIENTEEMYCFLDNLLNKGLDKGKCYIFYDEKQNIFTGNKSSIYDRAEFKKYNYTKFELLKNCRNSRIIKDVANTILEEDVSDLTKLNVDNDDVVVKLIKESDDGGEKVVKIIDKLLNEGVSPKSISILFNLRPTNLKNYIFNYLKKNYGSKIEEFSINSKIITYSTVSRFKGLENDVIIYVNDNKNANSKNHYVAISRAKAKAYVFCVK